MCGEREVVLNMSVTIKDVAKKRMSLHQRYRVLSITAQQSVKRQSVRYVRY